MARVKQSRRSERAGEALLAAGEPLLTRLKTPTIDPTAPTPLPGWDVTVLVAHLGHVLDDLVTVLDSPTTRPGLSASDYLRQYGPAADEIDARERGSAERLGWPGVVDRFATALERVGERLARPLPERVEGRRGPARTADLLAGRVLELVVHADDLDRALGDQTTVTFSRTSVQVAVRAATEALGERYPGHTIEVRVPPYAAVQCGIPGDGPTHTRGTPPNVVETDATTFLRLATGRMTWSAAVADGGIAASGNRADLSSMLPLW